jgi:sorbitol-specific phosphotransferase system component IIBC
VLSFLKDPQFPNEVKKLRITVRMDQAEVAAKVESEAPTEERAKQMATGYSVLLYLGQQKDKGRDEELLYKSTKISANGKQIVVTFSMPRQTAETMIKKKLPAS